MSPTLNDSLIQFNSLTNLPSLRLINQLWLLLCPRYDDCILGSHAFCLEHTQVQQVHIFMYKWIQVLSRSFLLLSSATPTPFPNAPLFVDFRTVAHGGRLAVDFKV